MVESNEGVHTGVNSKVVPSSALTLPVFACTLFLSAMLLFSIQPYFSKLVLPKLGGSPGVWSVAMVFFQGILLLGYCYAHLLTRFFQVKHAVIIHFALLLVAGLFLPLGIAAGWGSPPSNQQEIWLLGLFTASIGLPFFAVAANAPLLQAWFSQTGHKHAEDPYFLYGASNIGSFAALFLYILAAEPFMTLGAQSILWSSGYALLVAAIVVCGMFAWGQAAKSKRTQIEGSSEEVTKDKPLSTSQILSYILLAAIPSALTVAVTAHITLDVVSAPFLWVVPLSLFLLTFVLTFRSKPVLSLRLLSLLLPWSTLLAIGGLFFTASLPLFWLLLMSLLSFLIAVLFCHTKLYQLRPPAQHLTAFYLWMSFGGVLGGICAALIAPNLFNAVLEYPLLMLLVLFLIPLKPDETPKMALMNAAIGGVFAAVIWIILSYLLAPKALNYGIFIVATLGLIAFSAFIQRKSQSASFPLLILTVPFLFMTQSGVSSLYVDRSFFGVIKVELSDDGRFHTMSHGTTIHGSMKTSDLDVAVGQGTPEPLSYYHSTGKMAEALRGARDFAGTQFQQVGIVGLGTGSFLCHKRPGEVWTAFEIDEAVINAALNTDYFRFVSDCAPNTRMVVGDARLKLGEEPNNLFDFLLIDAFSSDSIPVHLMTEEALDLYFAKMKPTGTLAIHTSNRHLELASVLAAIAEKKGYVIRYSQVRDEDSLLSDKHIFSSEVVAMTRDDAYLGALAQSERWADVESNGVAPWKDDYSNILGAIARKARLD